MWLFSDLSHHSHGNLYITDYKNSCIRVFSNDGDFLHFFFCDGNEVKKFIRPDGVCVCVCVYMCVGVCVHVCVCVCWRVCALLSIYFNLTQPSVMLIECVSP